ncbi:MAG: DivIVA domain-containing protein [Solirubrobacterales bacterium]|nr:DivIVA domain-containing protein [Solirubrobacterales bacterium]
MPAQDTRSLLLEPRTPQGSQRARLSQIGQRLADAFRVTEPRDPGAGDTGVIERLTQAGEEEVPRFPISRRGYHCASVDDWMAKVEQEFEALNRELVQVQARSGTQDEVKTEIQRIGEQTSAVLIAAHEQREQILRSAQEEADRCVADARAQASRVTAESEGRLRELKGQGDALTRERDRLLEEARCVSVALAALVDGAEGEARSEAGGAG